MSRTLKYVLLLVVLAIATVWAIDDLVLRLRRQPFGSVTVQRYFALHKSKQKTNYMFAEPEAQVCVRSLLPHSGFTPCWYLSRHAEQRIDYE